MAEWAAAQIAGKPADVYEPAGARVGLVFLHPVGLETLRGNGAYTRLFDELKTACVCPHAGRSWWADRVCAEFDPAVTAEHHVVGPVADWCRQRWPLGPGLFGISMGGQGALRIGFRHPDRFPVVAAVAPAVDYHEWYGRGTPIDDMYPSREACRQDTATLAVRPHKFPPHVLFCTDPDDADWFRGGDRLHEKLTALGVPHEWDLSTRDGGHSWRYFDGRADRVVRFLVAGLEKESRRLA